MCEDGLGPTISEAGKELAVWAAAVVVAHPYGILDIAVAPFWASA